MKVWGKMLEARLRNLVQIREIQFGFQPGKATNDAIFILRQVQEKHAAMKKMAQVFVDLEKAFDRVPREALWLALRRQRVPETLVNQVMAPYRNSQSRILTSAGKSEEFEIKFGVNQGSSLSPLLFITVMEEAGKARTTEEGLWELLYANDLVIVAEKEEEVTEGFHEWKRALELRGLKVNLGKTKAMILGEESSIK